MNRHPIQLFRLIRHWVSAIMAFSGATNHGTPWHRTIHNGTMNEKGVGITDTTGTSTFTSPLPQPSRSSRQRFGLLCYRYLITPFHSFLARGFESLLSHNVTNFCPPLLHSYKIYRTLPRYTVVQLLAKSQKPNAALTGNVGSGGKYPMQIRSITSIVPTHR